MALVASAPTTAWARPTKPAANGEFSFPGIGRAPGWWDPGRFDPPASIPAAGAGSRISRGAGGVMMFDFLYHPLLRRVMFENTGSIFEGLILDFLVPIFEDEAKQVPYHTLISLKTRTPFCVYVPTI